MPLAGAVTLRMQAPNGLTTGYYNIQATLNAQFDVVSDGSTTAQSLTPSTIDVEPGPAIINRAAVLGSLERAVSPVLAEKEGVTNDLRGSWTGTPPLWTLNNNSGVTGSLNASRASGSKNYDASDAFSFYGRVGDTITIQTKGSSSGGGTLAKTTLTLRDPNGVQTMVTSGTGSDCTLSGVLPANGTYTITVGTETGKKGTYTLKASLTTPTDPRPNVTDLYSISATAGQWLSLAAATGSASVTQPKVQFTLWDPAGVQVASSTSVGALDGKIEHNAGQTGYYTVKVTGGPGLTANSTSYNLVGVGNGSFDSGANSGFASAQDITGRPGVLGSIASTADYYKALLSAGQTVTYSTSTPGDGSGQPANALDPHIELYDSAFALIAPGTPLADRRNEKITYTVPANKGGVYYVRVTGQDSTTGDYVLDPVSTATTGAARGAESSAALSETSDPAALAAWSVYERPGSYANVADYAFADFGRPRKSNAWDFTRDVAGIDALI